MQQASDEELVDVAIWIAGKPPRDQRERYLALAARFPQAREALERYGTPFFQADPALSTAIQQAYEDMLREDVQASLNPLIMHLQELKYTPAIIPGLPAVMVKLPKRVIVELSQRSDVGRIFLTERPAGPALDVAVSSNRIPWLWQQRVNGLPLDGEGGTRIGIVEGGTADIYSQAGLCASSPCFRHPGGVSGGFGPDDYYQHATLVASAATSDYAPRRGAAPGATIYSTGMVNGSDWALIDALHRALSANSGWYNVDVANVSWQSYCQQDMAYPDFAFDYWAREYRRTITVAAGNYALCNDYNLRSPGKAWNVITVGAYGDQNNSDWSDDSMWSDSTYINPFGDREKPEVAAPGADVEGISRNGILAVRSGTSLAAPQVAGLADLLIQRSDRLLRDFPMAVKAIIMAAAVHNIEGNSRLSDRDGAGGIDAILAEKAAGDSHPVDATVCTGSCWWNVEFNDQALPPGSRVAQRYFRASRGERVRVAIAWMSFAYCPDASYCPVDNPVNLDLVAFKPTDPTSPIATSASVNNNFEIIEFTAPDNGQYEIRVNKTTGGTGETINWLGIAWIKDATYLPDLANEAAGALHPWVSEIYIRNEAPIAREVAIYYHENEGVPTPKGADLCYLAPNQWCAIPMDEAIGGLYRIRPGTRGSATVQGGEDVTVLVMNTHQAAPYTADSYTGIAQTSPALRAPLIYRNNSSWQTDFTIYNPNSQADNFQVVYDAWSGAGCTTGWLNLPANGNFNVNQLGWPNCSLSSPFIGGARITSQSGRPLAGVAFQWNWVNSTQVSRMSYELFATGASPAYAPLVMRNNSGYYTGIGFQDTSGNAENLTLHYYQQDGSLCGASGPYYVGANGVYPVNPAPPNGICVPTGSLYIGGARATRGANLAFAGVVNQVRSGANTAMSYDMPPNGARTVIVPLVMRDRDNWRGKNDWITGFAIQNTAGSAAIVNIRYYAQDTGQLAGTSTISVAAYGVAIVNPAPGNISPFLGSAVIVADQPVAVMVDYTSTGTDDHGMSVAGVNR